MRANPRRGGEAVTLVRTHEAGLPDLATIADDAGEYVAQSLAASTRKAYLQDMRLFSEWCAAHGLEALPGEPETVALYLAAWAGRRSYALLQRRLVSITAAHKAAGYESPVQHPLVRRTWKGVRRVHGTASKPKAPLLTDDIRRMLATLDPTTDIGRREGVILFAGCA
jgi:hypothetical protein